MVALIVVYSLDPSSKSLNIDLIVLAYIDDPVSDA